MAHNHLLLVRCTPFRVVVMPEVKEESRKGNKQDRYWGGVGHFLIMGPSSQSWNVVCFPGINAPLTAGHMSCLQNSLISMR